MTGLSGSGIVSLGKMRGLQTPSGFSPLRYTPILWLDATTLPLADGAAVVSWTDSSGRGNHATQATGSKQPTYKTAILNGRSVVRFDGGDGLQTPSIDLSGSKQATLYVVCSAAAGTAQILAESSDNNNTSNTGFILSHETTNLAQSNVHHSGGHAARNNNVTWNTTHVLITTRYDRALPREKSWNAVNGVGSGKGTWSLLTRLDGASNAFAANTISIGCRDADASSGASAAFLTGDIAELVLFSGEHTPAQRKAMEAYLATKWNRTLTAVNGTIVFDGHSATEGAPLSPLTNYPHYLLTNELTGNYDTKNVAYQGKRIDEFTAWGPTLVHPWIDSAYAKQIIIVDSFSNDLFQGASVATIQSRITAYAAATPTAATLLMQTCLPRSDASTPVGFEADRITLNTWLRNNYLSLGIDALVDIAANTSIGDSGDELDTTYYNADKAHLNATGWALHATITKTALATVGVT